MKKQLIALAALAALCGHAAAQSNATLYGVADLGLERVKLSPGPAVTALNSGIQSGSRWGIKGGEDLGGGMAAMFQLESGFDASSGAPGQGGLAFGRQSWGGLKGGFGAVKLGRQYTPIFNALDTIDPLGTGITGDGSGMSAVFRGYGVRMNNAVNYSTPDFGGFSAEAAYGFGEVAGSSSTGSQHGAAGTYSAGALTLVGAYHSQNVAAGAVSAGKSRTFLLGGSYAFGPATVHAAYADNRDKDATGATAGSSRDAMLGVSSSFGATSVMASYIRHRDTTVSDANAGYWQLAATYTLSKRTNLYTSYSTIKNGANGATGSGLAGVDISWLNVGIRHKF